jgi:hypothetical protein
VIDEKPPPGGFFYALLVAESLKKGKEKETEAM